MTIRIDALPTTTLPSLEHVTAVMKDGTTAQLSIEQIGDVLRVKVETLEGKTLKAATVANGLAFGSNVVAAVNDFSKHLALWGTQFGFSISAGQFNHVASSGSKHVFITGTTARATIGAYGVVIGSPTGGDPGDGKLNAVELQQNGVPIPFSKFFESPEYATAVGAAGVVNHSVAHNLGGTPKLMQAVLRCKTAEAGYAIGDELMYSEVDATGVWGLTIGQNATHLMLGQYGAGRFLNKPVTTTVVMTPANWRWVLRAWR